MEFNSTLRGCPQFATETSAIGLLPFQRVSTFDRVHSQRIPTLCFQRAVRHVPQPQPHVQRLPLVFLSLAIKSPKSSLEKKRISLSLYNEKKTWVKRRLRQKKLTQRAGRRHSVVFSPLQVECFKRIVSRPYIGAAKTDQLQHGDLLPECTREVNLEILSRRSKTNPRRGGF